MLSAEPNNDSYIDKIHKLSVPTTFKNNCKEFILYRIKLVFSWHCESLKVKPPNFQGFSSEMTIIQMIIVARSNNFEWEFVLYLGIELTHWKEIDPRVK